MYTCNVKSELILALTKSNAYVYVNLANSGNNA